jgi:flagellar basal body-associated protein FliL
MQKFDLLTIIIVVITLTLLAIFGLVISNFAKQAGEELRETGRDMNINQQYVNDSTSFMADDLPRYTDNYILWFFVATFVGLILTALYLEFEPAVFIIILIFGAIAVLGAWMGSEINSEFALDENLAGTAGQMSKTQLLMSNPYFPVFVFIGLIVMLVVMYTKKRSGEYQ